MAHESGRRENAAGEGNDLLLVDDDTNVTELYTAWLEPAYDVTAVHTGDEALEALNDDFDAVLLDRRLPDWSGAALLAEFRERGSDHPVVMITGTEPDTDIVDLSIDEYLVKPVSEGELLDTVAVVLRVSSYDSLLQEYYSLLSKRAALHSSTATSDLRAEEAYPELEDRISSLEAQLDVTREAFDEDHYRQVFRRVLG